MVRGSSPFCGQHRNCLALTEPWANYVTVRAGVVAPDRLASMERSASYNIDFFGAA